MWPNLPFLFLLLIFAGELMCFSQNEEICLKRGILTPVIFRGIATRKKQGVNFDSAEVSKTSNLTTYNLDKIEQHIEELTRSPYEPPRYKVGDRKVFKLTDTIRNAPYECARLGAMILRVFSTFDIDDAKAIMAKENMDYAQLV